MARLERQFTEARLNALRMQLDPHFLFNALNTISSQMERDPRLARNMIERLGDLLRLSLASRDREEIPLAEELAFLDHYLAIQRIRFGAKLKIDVRIDPDVMYSPVPCLFIQPLVENAIRHGISRRASGGTVVVSAERVVNQLPHPGGRRWGRIAAGMDARDLGGSWLVADAGSPRRALPERSQPFCGQAPARGRHGSGDWPAAGSRGRGGARCRLRLNAFTSSSWTTRRPPGSGSSISCARMTMWPGSRRPPTDSEAVDMILGERPNLVFLDVQMPELDGLERHRGDRTDGDAAHDLRHRIRRSMRSARSRPMRSTIC